MNDDRKSTEFEQLSIADILRMSNDIGKTLSSKELEAAINKLREWQTRARNHEKIEQERREREERERKEREKQEKKDAHIREVTCMDLPLDWENVFNSDERTRGVHAESASDALVLSLTALGRGDIEYMSSITGMAYKDVI